MVRKPSLAVIIALGAACGVASITSFVGYSSATYAAWMTALPPQVERSLTLEQAREQYEAGMTVFKVSGTTAIALLGVCIFVVLRRYRRC